MNSTQIAMLFWFGCIPTRLVMALVLPEQILYYILPMISIGMFYLYFTKQRMNAFEAGGYTWWHNYRVLHAFNYFFAWFMLVYRQPMITRRILLFDVFIGIYAWLFLKN